MRSEHPGGATVAGASLNGSHLILSGFRVIGDEVTVQPGSTGMVVDHNLISGGYFGVDAGPTSSTNVNDVSVIGNKFQGPFGEDAIRANRYHDTRQTPTAYGLLVAGQRDHQRPRERQPLRLPAVGLGRRQPGLRPQLPARQPLPGLLHQGPAVHRDQRRRLRQPPGPKRGRLRQRPRLRSAELLPALRPRGQRPRLQQHDLDAGERQSDDLPRFGLDQRRARSQRRLPALDGRQPLLLLRSRQHLLQARDGLRMGCCRPPGYSTTACSPAFPAPTLAGGDDYRLGNGRGVDWRPARQHYGP